MRNFDLKGKNKYYTLYKNIREEILSGRIKAGERLPSKRALAQDTGVSVITVQLAYEQLLAEGYITSRERSGYFAEDVNSTEQGAGGQAVKRRYPWHIDGAIPRNSSSEPRYTADFVKGYAPAELFPFATWAKLMRTVLADCGEHLLERVPCCGDMQLRRAVAGYLYRARGISANPEHIIIGAGAEHLYGVLVQLLGRGTAFAVENPCYNKIYSTYRLYGAGVAPVNVIDTGICLDEVQKLAVSAVHVSPSHQFPTGAVTPAAARARLISWADKTGGYIIEDDYDSEFRLEGKPLQSLTALCPGRAVYMNTFSKSLAPSMRLGYMVLPTVLYKKYLEIFGHSANIVPLFEQKALALMLDGGYFERHVARLKNYYRAIRKSVLGVLEEVGADYIVNDNGGGSHFTVKFPSAQSDNEIKRKAENLGINVKCLSDYLIGVEAEQSGGGQNGANILPRYEKTAVVNYSGATAEQLSAVAEKLKK